MSQGGGDRGGGSRKGDKALTDVEHTTLMIHGDDDANNKTPSHAIFIFFV